MDIFGHSDTVRVGIPGVPVQTRLKLVDVALEYRKGRV